MQAIRCTPKRRTREALSPDSPSFPLRLAVHFLLLMCPLLGSKDAELQYGICTGVVCPTYFLWSDCAAMTTSQHHRTACRYAYPKQNSKNAFESSSCQAPKLLSQALHKQSSCLNRLGVLSPEQAHLSTENVFACSISSDSPLHPRLCKAKVYPAGVHCAADVDCPAFQKLQVEPENYPDKKDALIGEFRNYLKILRAVHSGADLQSSAEAAGSNLPGNAKGFLGYVLSHQFDNQILPLIENAVEARTELQQASKGNRCGLLGPLPAVMGRSPAVLYTLHPFQEWCMNSCWAAVTEASLTCLCEESSLCEDTEIAAALRRCNHKMLRL